MATLSVIRKERLKKLKRIQKAGILAYPAESRRTHTTIEALKSFASLARSQKELILVGRIRAIRGHGGSTFLNVEDGAGTVQAYLKLDRVGEKQYAFFIANFDIGDFVQLRGILFKTKKAKRH